MSKKITEMDLPRDLKKMDIHGLELMAVAIREFLIDSVSATGGHLASNLGIVEISLGLHKVFDSPHDKIIWDVGHQAYVHKILTGRAQNFAELRTPGGISGFPKRCESKHDIYETGHSSTSISAALGLAAARELKKESGEVIAVIGDGSMTGGPAFEALNNVSFQKSKIIIILNDNGMSISRNIGGMSKHLSELRTSEGYNCAKTKIKRVIGSIPVIGPALTSEIGGVKDRMKYALLRGGVIFEELGVKYLGPFDGNDMKAVVNALAQAKKLKQSAIIHFMTKKGKGYRPAEKEPDRFHSIGPFDPETGASYNVSKRSYSDVFGAKMLDISNRRPDVIGITAAMCKATGLSQMRRIHPDKVFDVGIAEAHAVIFAAGAAAGGLRPVVAIYSSFLQRAYDEIIEDVCLQKLPVTFAIDRAGIVGADGETHHGMFDLSYLLPMPGITVLAPCDALQFKSMLEFAVIHDGPVAIRYPRGTAQPGPITGRKWDGSNVSMREGADVTILAVGDMAMPAIKAADILAVDGIDAGVICVGTVKPFDFSCIPDNDSLIVTVEDNCVTGGFGEMTAAALSGRSVLTLALPCKFIEHGDVDYLFRKYGLDADGIADGIRRKLERTA